MKYWASYSIVVLAVILSLHFVQNVKINFKEYKNYIIFLFVLLLFLLNFEFTPISYRVIVNCFLYILLAKLIFRKTLKESCILGIMILAVNMIAEVLYVTISSPIINHILFTKNSAIVVFIQNFIIEFLVCLISLILGKYKIYDSIIRKVEKIKVRQITIFSLLLVVIFNFFMWFAYFVSDDLFNNSALSYVGSVISLFSVALVFSYLKTNNKYVDMSEKYSLSLNNIREYEEMIERNRIDNHEIRNQFLMLRNMSKNKKMTNYIDSILDNKITDSEELLNEVTRIPSGGLRGLIYTKLLLMDEKNINYELYVDKKINTRKINKIEANHMIDICKIIGVFLDNSIEAVSELNEKSITVEMYLERKDIVISVTNNFRGFIDIENLDKSGYTTKSDGHGYGLKLVSEILNKNDRLENYKEIYEDNFTQNLKIKM